jgi:thiamine-monophosphate kinase
MPSESEIISRLRKRVRVNSEVPLGIGDDAALIKTAGGRDLIACCDLMVEGVHFRTEWTPPRLLGRKALAANLSDVAAMGGVPKFAMTSIALPKWCSTDFVDELFEGILELANVSGVSIIGGDTSGSLDSLFIDVSLIGECLSGKAITRQGASIGDRIYVSGALGGSALGLSLLERGFRLDQSHDSGDARRQAVLKFLSPEPHSQLGRELGESGLASAMIDVSDGLSTDLWHILDESGVGAVIDADAIPIAECVTTIASEAEGIDPLTLALNGGEEYELLFTATASQTTALVRLSDTLGIRLNEIGEIVSDKGLQLARNGSFESLSPAGFEHLI